HTFIFLTKNPKRYSQFDFPKNAWIGYSTTGALYHKWDSRHKDNIKFTSIEPMMGDMVNTEYLHDTQWIICGKESGNRKERISPEPDWIERLIKITKQLDIKLFLKNNLQYHPLIQEFPVQD
ncbi:MAG: DUF5131 family protein, partial [Ignavibacteria bacterium]|nr:DUF5131 family protein [Ignavibacteria bacterium]